MATSFLEPYAHQRSDTMFLQFCSWGILFNKFSRIFQQENIFQRQKNMLMLFSYPSTFCLNLRKSRYETRELICASLALCVVWGCCMRQHQDHIATSKQYRHYQGSNPKCWRPGPTVYILYTLPIHISKCLGCELHLKSMPF